MSYGFTIAEIIWLEEASVKLKRRGSGSEDSSITITFAPDPVVLRDEREKADISAIRRNYDKFRFSMYIWLG